MLVGSLLLMAGNLARYGTTTLVRPRDRAAQGAGGNHEALAAVSDGLARTVKFFVIPGALLLLSGVLLRSSRRDDRAHQLSVETETD